MSIEGFVKKIAAEAAERDALDKPLKRKLFSSVVRECGWQKRSEQRLEALRRQLEQAGVFTVPILGMDVPLDVWIRFTTEPVATRAPADLFRLERQLKSFVLNFYPHLFKGHEGLEGSKFVDSEKVLYHKRHRFRADLVFIAPDGVTVYVELKKGDLKDGVTQLDRYLDAARAKGEQVRGVLITAIPENPAVTESLIKQVDLVRGDGSDIRWLCCSLDPQLVPPDSI